MIVLILLACCVCSLYLYRNSRFTLAIAIIAVSGMLIKIWACSDPWLHAWDERYHALAAKNMMHHLLKPTLYEHPLLPYDYRNWTSNHIWVHKQPVTLWLIALSLKLFGISAFAVRIPSIILSTISTILVYDIGAKWFSKKVGLVAAFLISINGLIIDLGSGNNSTDHVDVIFMFFVLLCVWLIVMAFNSQKAIYHAAAGIALGLAILTKWLPALIVAPIWLLLARKYYQHNLPLLIRHFALFLLAAICVALPWQLYIFSHYPLEASWEYHFNALHVTQALEGHSGNWLYHFDRLRILYGEAVYIPILWFMYQTIKFRKTEHIILLIWFLVPFVFFSIPATKMPAYTLLSAPSIFLMTAIFFWQCLEWWQQRSKYRYAFVIVALSLIILPVRYSIERLKPFDARSQDRAFYNDIVKTRALMTTPDKTVVINYPHYIELMFYTGCIAYEGVPDDKALNSLRQQGYTIIKK